VASGRGAVENNQNPGTKGKKGKKGAKGTLPAAFYPSSESPVVALRHARCPRLSPTSSRSPPRDSRFLSDPAPVPILVLGRRFPAFSILYPRRRQCTLVSASLPGRLSSAFQPLVTHSCQCALFYVLRPGRPCPTHSRPFVLSFGYKLRQPRYLLRRPEVPPETYSGDRHKPRSLYLVSRLRRSTSSQSHVLRPLVVSTLHCPGISSILLRLCTLT